jgi:hypothetical protein
VIDHNVKQQVFSESSSVIALLSPGTDYVKMLAPIVEVAVEELKNLAASTARDASQQASMTSATATSDGFDDFEEAKPTGQQQASPTTGSDKVRHRLCVSSLHYII